MPSDWSSSVVVSSSVRLPRVPSSQIATSRVISSAIGVLPSSCSVATHAASPSTAPAEARVETPVLPAMSTSGRSSRPRTSPNDGVAALRSASGPGVG